MSSFLEVKILSVETGLQRCLQLTSPFRMGTQISTLIEMFMRQAIKLKSISTGDVSAQKSVQVFNSILYYHTSSRGMMSYMLNLMVTYFQEKKVQKCVETLDALKISNARIKHVVVTTNWETFDHPPSSTMGNI
ncbi:hypothetical protein AHAS_Ahas10G0090900 [Arachis hypogaea]